MTTTITFEVSDDLTPEQASELARIAKAHISPLSYAPGGMAAELDHRIETARINEAALPDAMNGIPPSADLARRWFREALFHVPGLFGTLRGAWSNLGRDNQDLLLIDATARDFPAIGNFREQIVAVLADPMLSRKTARSIEIDGQMILAEDFIDGIAINPAHPPRAGVGEESRDDFEMTFWWGRPYICQDDSLGAYRVECLDGGAWDRPTQWGVSPDIAGALEIVMGRVDG